MQKYLIAAAALATLLSAGRIAADAEGPAAFAAAGETYQSGAEKSSWTRSPSSAPGISALPKTCLFPPNSA